MSDSICKLQQIVDAYVENGGTDRDSLHRDYAAEVRKRTRLVLKDYARGAIAFQTFYRAIGFVRYAQNHSEHNETYANNNHVDRVFFGRTLTYEMVAAWALLPAELQPLGRRLAMDAIDHLVKRFGSWRDVREICECIRQRTSNNTQHPVIVFCVRMLAEQLSADALKKQCNKNHDENHNHNVISSCAKWVPRERSARHRWLFTLLAKQYYLAHSAHASAAHSQKEPKAVEDLKEKGKHFWTRERLARAKGCLRRVLSRLNGPDGLGTLEVDMCNDGWDRIEPSKLPHRALNRNRLALMNEYKEPKGGNRARARPRVPRPPHKKRRFNDTDTENNKQDDEKKEEEEVIDLTCTSTEDDGSSDSDIDSKISSNTISNSDSDNYPTMVSDIKVERKPCTNEDDYDMVDLLDDNDQNEHDNDDEDDDRACLLGPVDSKREALAMRCMTSSSSRVSMSMNGSGTVTTPLERKSRRRRRPMRVAPDMMGLWNPKYACMSSAATRGVIWQSYDNAANVAM